MAQLIIEIPDAIAPEAFKTLGARFGYRTTTKGKDGATDVPNPETLEDFVQRSAANLLKQIYVATKVQQAEQSARKAAHGAAMSQIDLTQP